MAKTPGHLEKYNRQIIGQLKLGIIERVDNPVIDKTTHYLPHLSVSKDSVTSPMRMVFDCSARDRKCGVSLNDCLMKGQSLVEKLGRVLLYLGQINMHLLLVSVRHSSALAYSQRIQTTLGLCGPQMSPTLTVLW